MIVPDAEVLGRLGAQSGAQQPLAFPSQLPGSLLKVGFKLSPEDAQIPALNGE